MCEFQSIQTWTEGETFLVTGELQPPHPARAAGAGGHPLQQGPGGGTPTLLYNTDYHVYIYK